MGSFWIFLTQFPCCLHLTLTFVKTKQLLLAHSILDFICSLPVFPLMTSFYSRIHSRVAHCLCLLSLFWSVTISNSFLVFHDLDSLEGYWHMFPDWVCLMFFSQLDWVWIFGKETTEDVILFTLLFYHTGSSWYLRDNPGDVKLHQLGYMVFSR